MLNRNRITSCRVDLKGPLVARCAAGLALLGAKQGPGLSSTSSPQLLAGTHFYLCCLSMKDFDGAVPKLFIESPKSVSYMSLKERCTNTQQKWGRSTRVRGGCMPLRCKSLQWGGGGVLTVMLSVWSWSFLAGHWKVGVKWLKYFVQESFPDIFVCLYSGKIMALSISIYLHLQALETLYRTLVA